MFITFPFHPIFHKLKNSFFHPKSISKCQYNIFFLAYHNSIYFIEFMKFENEKLNKFINRKIVTIDISILIFVLSFLFIIMEFKHPYYFLSDDNRTFYLPFFTHNFRAIINGELPFFNFHQNLGISHFSNFQSAIFYPLTYFSMLLILLMKMKHTL